MKNDIYELYQDGVLILRGTKKHLQIRTKLCSATIDNYCTPGFLEGTKNETKTKVIKVAEE